MSLENKINRESKANRTSWKQKAARIGASVLLPIVSFGSFFGGVKDVKANLPTEPIKTLEADLNNDGIVNIRDFAIMAEQWLEKESWYPKNIEYIDSCQCLTEPNTTYVLAKDISTSGTCFVIEASGITLDLNGHGINGSYSDLGVLIFFEDATIKNGKINNFSYGISNLYIIGKQPNSTTIQDVDVKYNYVGIGLEHCNHFLSGITANSNEYGVYLEEGSGSTLSSITANSNKYGVILYGYDESSLSNINANSNTNNGISLYGCQNNLLSGITANSNAYGIILGVRSALSSNNNISGSTFSGNTEADVGSVSTSNIFLDCNYDSENGPLTRSWSYRTNVQDSSKKPVANAKVVGLDSKGGLEFAVTTGAEGYTPKIWLTEYENKGGIKTVFSPYTITATKDNKSATHVYDPNGFNSEDSFILSE